MPCSLIVVGLGRPIMISLGETWTDVQTVAHRKIESEKEIAPDIASPGRTTTEPGAFIKGQRCEGSHHQGPQTSGPVYIKRLRETWH